MASKRLPASVFALEENAPKDGPFGDHREDPQVMAARRAQEAAHKAELMFEQADVRRAGVAPEIAQCLNGGYGNWCLSTA